MSATHYKKLHVDIFICIEMGRERNRVIKKEHPVFLITLHTRVTALNVKESSLTSEMINRQL